MSHHSENFAFTAPKPVSFVNGEVTLPVAGQGVVIFSPESKDASLEIMAPPSATDQDIYQFFWFHVTEFEASFYAAKTTWASDQDKLFTCKKGFDQYPNGPFWFSIDFENRLLKGGYGEPRAELALFSFDFKDGKLTEGNVGPILKPTEANDPAISRYKWLKELESVNLSTTAKLITVFKDPITVAAPMQVKDMNDITMGDVSNYSATVPANLPSVCQQLYENVGGRNFNLANINKDFDLNPNFNFAKAVQYSIDTKGMICNKIIQSKVDEFGDPDMVYLRITMGGNQGESPGIPYVMEIWPSGKRSPIHNHGGSEAIIKVLHGEIECKLFATLSKATPYTNLLSMEAAYEPNHFKTCHFTLNQVTYITPWLNQIHQLRNTNPVDACITIQCYGYPLSNDSHYEYFDWLNTDDHEIDQFYPDSDYSFNDFVLAIYAEYTENHPDQFKNSAPVSDIHLN